MTFLSSWWRRLGRATAYANVGNLLEFERLMRASAIDEMPDLTRRPASRVSGRAPVRRYWLAKRGWSALGRAGAVG